MPQGQLMGGPMVPHFGNPGFSHQELLLRQLGAGAGPMGEPGPTSQQALMMAHPGNNVPPALLVQLLTLQNQAMAQSMHAANFGMPNTAMPGSPPVAQLGVAPAQPSQGQSGRSGGISRERERDPEVTPRVAGRDPLLVYTHLDEGRLTTYQVRRVA